MKETTGIPGMWWGKVQRPIVNPYLLGAVKKKKKKIKKKSRETNGKKKQKLLFFPKLGATSRVRTGGQKLFSVTQPFPSCLPTPRPSGKSPEEDSTGVNALTPLALGGHRDTADFNQLRLWLLPAQNGLTGE